MDLSLISEDELLDELSKRNDSCIFARRQELTNSGKAERRRFWSGDKEICLGLCQGVIDSLTKDIWHDED